MGPYAPIPLVNYLTKVQYGRYINRIRSKSSESIPR